MNSKRLAALLLALTMALSVLSGCGHVEEEPIENPDITTGAEITLPPETTTVPETTTEPITTPEPTTTPETTTEPVTTTEATTTAATTAATKKTSKDDFTVEKMNATVYATMSLNVRKGPSTDFDRIGAVAEGDELTVTGRASTGWYQISFNGETAYVSNLYVSNEKPAAKPAVTTSANNNNTTPAPSGDDEEVVDDGDSENVDDEPSLPASTNPSPNYTFTSSDWMSDNACEYQMSAFTQEKYVKAMEKIALGIQVMAPSISLAEYLTEDETMEFAGKLIHIAGTGYCYFDRAKVGGTTIYPIYYTDDYNTAMNMQTSMANQAAKIVEKCSGYSDYNKVKFIYEYLIKNSSYGGNYGGSAYGPIVDGHGTCLGYAKATFYLLSKAGLDVLYVVGRDQDMHAWVKVKINGSWYNVDTTWGDPNSTVTEDDPSYVNYDFLCVTDRYILNTRPTVYDLSKFYSMPSATSNDLNWFVLNGCYAETYEDGVNILREQIKACANDTSENLNYIRVQFSNEAAFQAFFEHYTQSAVQSEFVDVYAPVRKVKGRHSDAKSETKRTLTIMYRLRKK